MSESKKPPLCVEFARQLKLAFQGATVTSDTRLLAYRELDEKLPLTSTASQTLHETQTGQSTRHSIQASLRQSIYSRLAGHEDVNDAQRLCQYPTIPEFRLRVC